MTENQTEAANVAVTTITKADREARKAFFRNAGLRLGGDHLDMAEQAADEAFAKHRLAHTSPDAGALREAAVRIALDVARRENAIVDEMSSSSAWQPHRYAEGVAEEIASAIATLAPEPSARDTIIATADRLARRLGAEFVPHDAGAPEPSATRLTPEWCLNMAALEGNAEIGAGALDHSLRLHVEPSAAPVEEVERLTDWPLIDAIERVPGVKLTPRQREQITENVAALSPAGGARLLPKIEAEARRYASHYAEASDGRNTFVMFADWIAALASSTSGADVAVPAGSVDALRYVLNWADSNSRVKTIMRTFTDDRVTTQEKLEALWKHLATARKGRDAG